jgi:hypothetical protein
MDVRRFAYTRFSTGFSSGEYGGSRRHVMSSGTDNALLLCPPAPSRISTACSFSFRSCDSRPRNTFIVPVGASSATESPGGCEADQVRVGLPVRGRRAGHPATTMTEQNAAVVAHCTDESHDRFGIGANRGDLRQLFRAFQRFRLIAPCIAIMSWGATTSTSSNVRSRRRGTSASTLNSQPPWMEAEDCQLRVCRRLPKRVRRCGIAISSRVHFRAYISSMKAGTNH